MMIDIHCHILPGLDDGAFSEDESLAMAEIAAAGGIRAICCTPHSGGYPFDTLVQTYRRFKDAVRERNLPLQLYLGQEIYLGDNMRAQIRALQHGFPVTLNRSVYPLIEFHPDVQTKFVFSAVEELVSLGYIPVIAHPERYAFAAEDVHALRRLKKAGALLQLNCGSLKGVFGYTAERIANDLLGRCEADFVASDAHSPYARTPRLHGVHAYISEQYSLEYADHLMCGNPQKLVHNRRIDPFVS